MVGNRDPDGPLARPCYHHPSGLVSTNFGNPFRDSIRVAICKSRNKICRYPDRAPSGRPAMNFLLSLWANPLARKIITYAAIIAAILYGMRLWGNKQWAKGEAQGRLSVAQDIEKKIRAEWKAKEDAIARDAASIATEKRAVAAAAEQLAVTRANLSRSLNTTLAAIQQERNHDYEKVAAVPSNLLDAALRSVSGELTGSTVP